VPAVPITIDQRLSTTRTLHTPLSLRAHSAKPMPRNFPRSLLGLSSVSPLLQQLCRRRQSCACASDRRVQQGECNKAGSDLLRRPMISAWLATLAYLGPQALRSVRWPFERRQGLPATTQPKSVSRRKRPTALDTAVQIYSIVSTQW